MSRRLSIISLFLFKNQNKCFIEQRGPPGLSFFLLFHAHGNADKWFCTCMPLLPAPLGTGGPGKGLGLGDCARLYWKYEQNGEFYVFVSLSFTTTNILRCLFFRKGIKRLANFATVLKVTISSPSSFAAFQDRTKPFTRLISHSQQPFWGIHNKDHNQHISVYVHVFSHACVWNARKALCSPSIAHH